MMPLDWSTALPTFTVTLREGFEAALAVGIVLTYLYKAQKQFLVPWAYGGVGVGLAASVLLGMGLTWVFQQLISSTNARALILKPLLEAGFGLVAIVLLSWMLLWMTQQGKQLKAELEGAIQVALGTNQDVAGWGIFSLVCIAVLREGFETVLFLATQFQAGFLPVLGAIAGLGVAVAICLLMFQLSIKLNIRQFFQIIGVLLLLIVAGLMIGVLRHMDMVFLQLAQTNAAIAQICGTLTSNCILGTLVWDASNTLPDRQFPGVLLKALFGYRQKLYLTQVISYITFLTVMGGFYWQSLTGRSWFANTPISPASQK